MQSESNSGHGGVRRPATGMQIPCGASVKETRCPPCRGRPKLIEDKTSRRQSGLASPQVMCLFRVERVHRPAAQQAPVDQDRRVTVGKGRRILGTGLRKRNPPPSSRETAKPPRWVSGRGGTVAINRLYNLSVKGQIVLSGPRRAQVRSHDCQQNRPDAGSGPRGHIASDFVGLLFSAA